MSLSDRTQLYTRRAFVGVASHAAWVLFSGARSDPGFMRYDAAARRVDLTIVAGFDKSNSGFNLNGGSHGRHCITVPAGWRVRLTFINRDIIRHSVVVIRERGALPMCIVRSAFSGAASRQFERGAPAGAREDDIVFVARRPGTYLVACGVPGHGALGGYLRLTVSSGVRIPTYEVDSIPLSVAR